MRLGNFFEAATYGEEAMRAAERMENNEILGHATMLFGSIYHTLGEFPKALEYYHRSLSHFHHRDGDDGIIMALLNIGEIHCLLKDWERALEHTRQCIELCRARKNRFLEASVLSQAAFVYLDRRQLETALDFFTQALTIQREIGDCRGQIVSMHGIGRCHLFADDSEKARTYFEDALALEREIALPYHQVMALMEMGMLLTSMGSLDEAIAHLNEALPLAEKGELRERICHIHGMISFAYEKGGMLEKALERVDSVIANAFS